MHKSRNLSLFVAFSRAFFILPSITDLYLTKPLFHKPAKLNVLCYNYKLLAPTVILNPQTH